MIRGGFYSAVILALALSVSGCTVRADENEVVIEHTSVHIGIAQEIADRHCDKFGKMARLVQFGREQAGFLGLRKRVSVFACVERAS